MNNVRTLIRMALVLFLGSMAFAIGCRGTEAPPAATAPAAPLPEFTTTATIKDIMLGIIDPSADVVWGAVTTVSTEKGIEEKRPKNDEEWAEVRLGAIRLIEATNLLLIPGRKVALPHERSVAPGVELEPEEIEALIDKDRVSFNARTKVLHEVGVQALAAIDAKDPDKLFEIGSSIEGVCESCHMTYWYPNQVIPDFPAELK